MSVFSIFFYRLNLRFIFSFHQPFFLWIQLFFLRGGSGEKHNEIMIFSSLPFSPKSFLIRRKYLLLKWMRTAFENKVAKDSWTRAREFMSLLFRNSWKQMFIQFYDSCQFIEAFKLGTEFLKTCRFQSMQITIHAVFRGQVN